jgi:hypothetical protein
LRMRCDRPMRISGAGLDQNYCGSAHEEMRPLACISEAVRTTTPMGLPA